MFKPQIEYNQIQMPQRFMCHGSSNLNTIPFNANTYLDRLDGDYVKIELKHIAYCFDGNVTAGQTFYYTADVQLAPFSINQTSTATTPNVLHLMTGTGKDVSLYNFHADGSRGVSLVLHKNDIRNNNGQLNINIGNFNAYSPSSGGGKLSSVSTPIFLEAILEITTIEHISSLAKHP